MVHYYVIPGLKFTHRDRALIANTRDVDSIIKAVSERYDIPFKDLASKTRKREVVYARQVAMTMLHRYSRISLKNIGIKFNRDHTTVIHSKNTIQDLIDTDDMVKQDVKQMEYLIIG